MSLTRDQLRAARVLLHLRQPQLAEIARIGIATIRRFEGGQEIGHLYLDAIRRALVDAGAIFIDGEIDGGAPMRATGVALRSDDELPEATRARITASRTKDSVGAGNVEVPAERASSDPISVGRKRGRPKKVTPDLSSQEPGGDPASADADHSHDGAKSLAKGKDRAVRASIVPVSAEAKGSDAAANVHRKSDPGVPSSREG